MQLNDIKIKGIDFKIVKDGNFSTCGFLHQRKGNILSFISSKKYMSLLKNVSITSIICTDELVDDIVKLRNDIGILVYHNPRELIFEISNVFKPNNFKSIISNSAKISDKAIISNNNVYIGESCIIEDNVIIKENVIIRNNVTIGSGTILGSEGLMVYKLDNHKKVATHNGYLYINANSKLLNNIVIERAVFKGDITYIGKEVLIDSGVSISHGCKINNGTMIIACAKICGYTEVGENCYIGPSSTLTNNIKIGDNCNIRIGSVVVDNLEDNSDVSSSFAINHQVNLINRFNILRQFKNVIRSK
jgi:UDP-3-O-[3-hydroxymyristoyl] glucosamine N-acyltransferase